MKRRSIRFKILFSTIASMVSVGIVAAAIGISFLHGEALSSAKTRMNFETSYHGDAINLSLVQIEDATMAVSYMAHDYINSVEELRNSQSNRKNYLNRLEKNFDSITGGNEEGSRTPGATGYYFVFSPEISGLKKDSEHAEGFFFRRDVKGSKYEEGEIVNYLKFEDDDLGHIAWWSIPTKEESNPDKKAIWLSPYHNLNLGQDLISYISPIWAYDDNEQKNTLIGIVGMDVDFSYITDAIKSISFFKSGRAFLQSKDKKLIYHSEIQPNLLSSTAESVELVYTSGEELLDQDSSDGELISYRYNGVNKSAAFITLRNGMRLFLSADHTDIYSSLRVSAIVTSLTTLALIVIFSFMTYFIVKRVTKPITEINEAAKEIANGQLSVTLDVNQHDEIGELATSFNLMSEQLSRNMRRIQEIAYQDSLTSVKNKTAYDKEVEKLNDLISKGEAEFALIMVDINELKYTNDHFGHEAGDQNISLTARAISRIFIHSSIYRIGGDEFVIIAQEDDFTFLESRIKEMESITKLPDRKSLTSPSVVSVSFGYAVCHKGEMKPFADIFRKADAGMYSKKRTAKKSNKSDKQ
ncbi:MAG: diguanylate cyclase [Bacilli bacterium]|nr:diguanylate cyclase [Bacilli bacterium]